MTTNDTPTAADREDRAARFLDIAARLMINGDRALELASESIFTPGAPYDDAAEAALASYAALSYHDDDDYEAFLLELREQLFPFDDAYHGPDA